MRVGIGDAERLKVSRLPPHPSGLRPCPPTPSGLQPSPPDRGSRPSPLRGEGFCSAQIGRNLVLCGTFGYIYWELWRSAPVGGAGGPGVPLLRSADPYRSGFCPLIRPLRGHLPPEGKVYGAHTVRPYGLFTNGSTYRKRDRSGTCPLKHRGETQFRTKFLCLLSFSKKVSYSRMAPRSAEDTILA